MYGIKAKWNKNRLPKKPQLLGVSSKVANENIERSSEIN